MMPLSTLLYLSVVLGIAGLADATPVLDIGQNGRFDASSFFQNPNQLLSMPLRRVNHDGPATPSIAKRFFKTDVLGVYGAAYLAELTIGTSTTAQVVDVLIDTGSFELWVDPNCTNSNVPDFCTAFGSYDPAMSSTSQKLGTDFDIQYGSGSSSGPYYKDDIYISGIGAKISAQQFGVANTSDLVWFGILGLGYGQGNGFINYPLVVDSLAAQGYTNSKLFSMELGGQPAPGAAVTGEMVFGGVDVNRYSGNLGKVPTDPTDPHYKVTLNSLGNTAPGSTVSSPFLDSNIPLSVIIDSGTTLSLLPESIVTVLAALFPGSASDGNGGYTVPCSFQDQNGTIDFDFLSTGNSRVTINVSYRDFIWNSGGDCYLGAWHTDNIDVWILGDTFLRGTYVSFDQSNNAVYMSNYKTCGSGSNLVPVPAGPDAVAQIPGACPVIAVAPSSSASSTPPPTASLAGGPVSNTVLPSAAASFGPSLNPLGPGASVSPTGSSSMLPSVSSAIGSSTPASIVISTSPSIVSSTSNSVTTLFPTSTSATGPAAPPANNNGNGSGASSATPVTTVPLNHPTAIPPGAPAQADPASSTTDPRIGADAPRPTITITSTITRPVTYTVTKCPATVTNCPYGQLATRTETIITTFCPGFPGGPALPSATGTPAGMVTESTAPTNQVTAPPIAAPVKGVTVGSEEDGPVTVTEHCSTSTYTVATCDPQDDACTVGMTTTRILTIPQTVRVQALATETPDAASSESDDSTPSANLNPPAAIIAAAAALGSGSYNGSGSGMGVAGLQTECFKSCNDATFADATITPVLVGSADDGRVDRRFLVWVTVGMFGVMVLL